MAKISFSVLLLFVVQSFCVAQTDSLVYYLNKVTGLESKDTALLLNAQYAINYNADADSIIAPVVMAALDRLYPIIKRQNYLALKARICINLIALGENDYGIKISKELIDSLKNYTNDDEKILLLGTIGNARIPFRNSDRIYEGLEYFQRLTNYFELKNDSDAISVCYYVLTGVYRPLGLFDKVIYCQKKSTNYLNPQRIVKADYFLIPGFENIGMIGVINRKAVLGGLYIENKEPLLAFPVLYQAKNIFERIKDSVTVSDGPYIYLQLAEAKIAVNGDSVYYYFSKMKALTDSAPNPIFAANYYQERSHYSFLKNDLDSAEYFIKKTFAVMDSFHLIAATFSGYLIPGFYLASIRSKQHKYPEAIELLNKEITELLKINLRRFALKELLLLSEVYKLNGDYKNSTVTLEKYNNIQTLILNDENKSRSVSFETEQQINALNAQKQSQQQEIKKQTMIRKWVTGGLLLFVFFSIVFFIQRNRISKEKKRSEDLLLNILPAEVAEELKSKGATTAKDFSEVTVLFTDFKNFTSMSEKLSAQELVNEINYCYSAFDNIISKHGIEKIKTIGDSYMCADYQLQTKQMR